nr:RNA-directed DNA polymerase, eukaryota, reverse transcriptase zinc-binding domain protein [Tanacetum cinerariifolium]
MYFPDKLRGLKSQLKASYSRTKKSEYNLKKNILMSLRSLDTKIDAVCASDEDRHARVNKHLELEEIDKLESMDLMQKARLEWDIEGDENSKFVHGIINSKRKSQMINSILNEGVKVVKAIHGEEVGFELLGSQSSGVWARIVGSIFHLHSSGMVPLSSIHFNLGDGSLIRFCKDIWLGDVPLCSRFNRLFHLDKNKDCLVKGRYANGDWSWDWNRDMYGVES